MAQRKIKPRSDAMDFFELRTPENLFDEIISAYTDYQKNPRDRELMFLISGLNHLIEWICDGQKYIKVSKKPIAMRTEKQSFMIDLHQDKNYRIIKSLCNRGKHFVKKKQRHKTQKVVGPVVGYLRAGDNLGHHYDVVDGQDIREIFEATIARYRTWFDKHPNQPALQAHYMTNKMLKE